MVYTVFVDDNFHYMDESKRYKLGEFADCASAVAACKHIVDVYLARCDRNLSADEMFGRYRTFGEDPWIKSPDESCRFSAWTYARERCSELAVPIGTNAPRVIDEKGNADFLRFLEIVESTPAPKRTAWSRIRGFLTKKRW